MIASATQSLPALAVEAVEPFGCSIQAHGASLQSVPLTTLRRLALAHRVVVLRGARLLDPDELVVYAGGPPALLRWSFGFVLDVIEHEDPVNYIFTHGAVPLHWDGAFAAQVPSFQLFQCRVCPLVGGETVFVDTPGVIEALPPATLARWRSTRITYRSDKIAHYGGEITVPLVATHPTLGCATLRFAEPFDEDTVPLNELEVTVEDATADEQRSLIAELREHLYAEGRCYRHRWQQGDVVLADNHALLHGRRAHARGDGRHLQRAHLL